MVRIALGGPGRNPILKLAAGALAIMLACVLFVDQNASGCTVLSLAHRGDVFGWLRRRIFITQPSKSGSLSPLSTVSDEVSLGDLYKPSKWRRPFRWCAPQPTLRLSGDALTNLYRGGSSLTLSPIAVSIGDTAIGNPKLEFSVRIDGFGGCLQLPKG